MNIVCVEPLGISQEHFENLKKEFASQGHSFQYYLDRKEDAPTLTERMKEADIAVISNIKLPADVLQQCTHLQYLSVAFTGLDHIDLAYCKSHNIAVQNAAGYSTTAVSELAVGMMLDLLRQITHFDGTIREGKGRGRARLSRNGHVGRFRKPHHDLRIHSVFVLHKRPRDDGADVQGNHLYCRNRACLFAFRCDFPGSCPCRSVLSSHEPQ